jgi:hypothetical protein
MKRNAIVMTPTAPRTRADRSLWAWIAPIVTTTSVSKAPSTAPATNHLKRRFRIRLTGELSMSAELVLQGEDESDKPAAIATKKVAIGAASALLARRNPLQARRQTIGKPSALAVLLVIAGRNVLVPVVAPRAGRVVLSIRTEFVGRRAVVGCPPPSVL